MIGDLLVLIGIVLVAAGGGITLGMLVAPRLGRLVDRGQDEAQPEDPRDDLEP